MNQSRGTLVAVVFLLVVFAQTAFASQQLSLTYDEPIYTAVGYADLTTGDMHWHGVIGHPPLVNLLTAWPLLLGSARPDPKQALGWGTEDSLGFSRNLLSQLGSLEQVTLATRLPVMWFALLLAAVVYRWAQQAWGGWAGFLALGLFTLDPNIVAHAQLNTTDIGLTAFGFVACYALARYLHQPSLTTYLATGLGLGAALASKASGSFWLAAAGLVVFLFWMVGCRPLQLSNALRSLWVWLIRLAGFVVLALLVLWASYLFEVRSLDPGSLPLPAASHWEGLSYIRTYMETGQTTFLAGRLVPGGHWSYFPLALLIKTPLPMLIGLLSAALWSLRRGVGLRWSIIPLVVVPLVYLVVAVQMALNIGYRHLLPMLPFTFVFVSQLAGVRGPFHGSNRRWRWIVLSGLAIWYVVGTLTIFPHYLAYFNELAGGPDGGYRYLADSSIDWGQGLKALKHYLDARDGKKVRLAAFSSLAPSLYGLDVEPIPPTVEASINLTAPFDPEPGLYVISAVPLQGVWLLDPDTYDWFRHRQPVDRVGHVLFVYDVPSDPAPSWVAQCAAPLPILDADQVAAGFGRSGLRLTAFDCEQSWLFPAGNAGWFVLPDHESPEDWVSERLAGVPLSFHQGKLWSHPALTIYAQQAPPKGAVPPFDHAKAAPSSWPLNKAARDGTAMAAPIGLRGPLTFLGYGIHTETDETAVTLHTYWRVDEVPARPLSLMAHLLDAKGTALAVADGLGVPIEGWQPGDVIVQRHRLTVPENNAANPLWLQTGAYWLDTVERWPIVAGGQVVGDRLLLAEIVR